MKFTVVNKHKDTYPEAQAMYCARPTALGNPYPMLSPDDRYSVIHLYKQWFNREVKRKNPAVLDQLEDIRDLALEHDHVYLECFCAPLPCHCDEIKSFMELWRDIGAFQNLKRY